RCRNLVKSAVSNLSKARTRRLKATRKSDVACRPYFDRAGMGSRFESGIVFNAHIIRSVGNSIGTTVVTSRPHIVPVSMTHQNVRIVPSRREGDRTAANILIHFNISGETATREHSPMPEMDITTIPGSASLIE